MEGQKMNDQKRYRSRNMNYIFNIEYMEDLKTSPNFEEKNKEITKFQFKKIRFFQGMESIPGFETIELETTYPGLLIGTGGAHDLNEKEVIKCGFTFDYVTGIPYYPGSSLKGILRSYFPGGRPENEKEEYEEYIKSILQEIHCENIKIDDLETQIFDNSDVFLGAYPVGGKGNKWMELEYITPHKKIYQNPIPINLIKVKPGVKFKFGFLLSDYVSGDQRVTAEQKKELFLRIILDMGVGAKTNVGFGKFKTPVKREVFEKKR
ncbi:type III-B CRISPR module RAMP protein Cmr6 [Lachnoclostridium sp. An181]|nr:type III-B CRISPR module RAMP protein Cmr6 [Lachnoclostridium sp. An181]